jgi:hypothetical protein
VADTERELEQSQGPESIRSQQQRLTNTRKHRTDDQGLAPTNQIGQIATGNFADQHHQTKQSLQRENLLHGQSFTLEERHRDGHDHQKYLEKP